MTTPDVGACSVVDRYLQSFCSDEPAERAVEAMAGGYTLDDGAVHLVAAEDVVHRVALLREGAAARSEVLEAWELHDRGGSETVVVVRADLVWRSGATRRTQPVDYVVRHHGSSDRIVAIVANP